MKFSMPPRIAWMLIGLLGVWSLLLGSGCGSSADFPPEAEPRQISEQVAGKPAVGQPLFDSDKAAVDALLAAVKAQDHDEVHRLLGPAWKELVSGDKVEDANAFKEFAERAAEQMRIERQDDSTSFLHVGKDDWEMPIPVARTPDGKWFLDTETGKLEVLARRIGKNELHAIQICRMYVQAQRQYATKDRDGSGVVKYGQRILSSPGKMDGLYWDAAPGQEQSPLGRLIAQEKVEGYSPTPGQHSPYRGYRFRVLKRQGPSAPGGKFDYVINGNMVAGFALVAWPVEYEASGIMTFIVNQSGTVYQKDLGANTAKIASQMDEFNPDGSWKIVNE